MAGAVIFSVMAALLHNCAWKKSMLHTLDSNRDICWVVFVFQVSTLSCKNRYSGSEKALFLMWNGFGGWTPPDSMICTVWISLTLFYRFIDPRFVCLVSGVHSRRMAGLVSGNAQHRYRTAPLQVVSECVNWTKFTTRVHSVPAAHIQGRDFESSTSHNNDNSKCRQRSDPIKGSLDQKNCKQTSTWRMTLNMHHKQHRNISRNYWI